MRYEWSPDKDITNLKKHGISSVSYTHLDVYKRQDRCNILIPLASSENLSATPLTSRN